MPSKGNLVVKRAKLYLPIKSKFTYSMHNLMIEWTIKSADSAYLPTKADTLTQSDYSHRGCLFYVHISTFSSLVFQLLAVLLTNDAAAAAICSSAALCQKCAFHK